MTQGPPPTTGLHEISTTAPRVLWEGRGRELGGLLSDQRWLFRSTSNCAAPIRAGDVATPQELGALASQESVAPREPRSCDNSHSTHFGFDASAFKVSNTPWGIPGYVFAAASKRFALIFDRASSLMPFDEFEKVLALAGRGE